MIPVLAKLYVPVLVAALTALWPSMPDKPTLAAQVEQETCISLTSKGCWNPKTELKTSREYGFGLSMLTITAKFNNFVEAKGWDKSLANWQWADRYNPDMQLKALVAYDRNLFNRIKSSATEEDRLAFMFSAYNGGLGGVLKDRRLCASTAGCDSSKWLGNVEKYSFRSRTAVKGYGQSFFDINRGYVKNIMVLRVEKYRELF